MKKEALIFSVFIFASLLWGDGSYLLTIGKSQVLPSSLSPEILEESKVGFVKFTKQPSLYKVEAFSSANSHGVLSLKCKNKYLCTSPKRSRSKQLAILYFKKFYANLATEWKATAFIEYKITVKGKAYEYVTSIEEKFIESQNKQLQVDVHQIPMLLSAGDTITTEFKITLTASTYRHKFGKASLKLETRGQSHIKFISCEKKSTYWEGLAVGSSKGLDFELRGEYGQYYTNFSTSVPQAGRVEKNSNTNVFTYYAPKFTNSWNSLQKTARSWQKEISFAVKLEIPTLRVKDNTQEVLESNWYSVGICKVSLTKPPVILLHGLWSSPEASGMYVITNMLRENSYRYVICREYEAFLSVDTLLYVVSDHAQRIRMEAAEDKILTDKFDIVTHSYGGLIAQFHGVPEEIRSIVLVGVPHFGSPFADLLWSMFREENDVDKEQKFLHRVVEKIAGCATCGAIDDIRTRSNGGKWCFANKLGVPRRVIVGYNKFTENWAQGSYLPVIAWMAAYYSGLKNATTPAAFHKELFGLQLSDWIVGEDSQDGFDAKRIKVDLGRSGWHALKQELNHPDVMQEIINFLERSFDEDPSIKSYFDKRQPRRHPQSLQRKITKARGKRDQGSIEILYPSPGDTIIAGDTSQLVFKVKCQGKNPRLLFALENTNLKVLFGPNFTCQYKVSDNTIGTNVLQVTARSDKGHIEVKKIDIQVGSQHQLIDLEFDKNLWEEIWDDDLDEVVFPLVGTFSDGKKRKVNIPYTPVQTKSLTPDIVYFTSTKKIKVRSPGQAVVKVITANFEKEIIFDSFPYIKQNRK